MSLTLRIFFEVSYHRLRGNASTVLTATDQVAAGGVSRPAYWAPASLIRPTPKKTPVA